MYTRLKPWAIYPWLLRSRGRDAAANVSPGLQPWVKQTTPIRPERAAERRDLSRRSPALADEGGRETSHEMPLGIVNVLVKRVNQNPDETIL